MNDETIADIVAEMRELAEKLRRGTPSLDDIEAAVSLEFDADRVEAAARMAYNKIDSAVCGIEAATSSDIDDVRKAMDETIGEYYE